MNLVRSPQTTCFYLLLWGSIGMHNSDPCRSVTYKVLGYRMTWSLYGFTKNPCGVNTLWQRYHERTPSGIWRSSFFRRSAILTSPLLLVRIWRIHVKGISESHADSLFMFQYAHHISLAPCRVDGAHVEGLSSVKLSSQVLFMGFHSSRHRCFWSDGMDTL